MAQNSYKSRRLLIVDDEPDLLELVSAVLKNEGYSRVETAASVREARSKMQSFRPEAAVIDIMLPDGNGFSLCDEMRKTLDIPILFLTARGEEADRLQGLGRGADDYITKPFYPQELALRVSAVLRRCYRADCADAHTAAVAAGVIDFDRAVMVREGREIPLTAKECALLGALCRSAGRIVSIDALCTAAWGDNYFGYETSLLSHIRRIREKIERDPSRPQTLLTVRGLGYKLLPAERQNNGTDA